MNKNIYQMNNCFHCKCENNDYFCRKHEFMPSDPSLAFAYVPYQKIEEIYTPETGLMQGTIYPQLDMPYEKNQGYMQLMELYKDGD